MDEQEDNINRLKEVEKKLHDPTALLENPEFMVQLFENSPDAIVIVDDRGIVRLMNRQAELMFGFHRSELHGLKVELLMPDEYRNRHETHRRHYQESPHLRPMGIGMELEGCRRDGVRFPVQINLSPIMTRVGMFVIATVRKRDSNEPATH